MTAQDNQGTRNLRPERVDGWRRGVQVLAICVSVWGKPMGCTLDDVPELAAWMARSCPGCCGDGGPLGDAGKVEFGFRFG